MLREALLKSRDKWTVWNTTEYSIVDRPVRSDRSLWVVQPIRN